MKKTNMKEWKENAWRNAHDIPLRNDNAPVLSDYIKAFNILGVRLDYLFSFHLKMMT